ncbi:AMP-binding protein [Flavobacteriales bacterium]|nr:AMP-binding protein [Flavobacteriales bacterium]
MNRLSSIGLSILSPPKSVADKVAIVHGDQQLTYAQLASRVLDLSDILRKLSVGHSQRTAIDMPKSIDAVVTILAVLNSNGTCIPLDHGSPSIRKAQMISDSRPHNVITTGGGSILLSREDQNNFNLVEHNLEMEIDVLSAIRVDAEGPANQTSSAYMLYTSGTTGLPKAVMISPMALKTFIDWCSEMFRPNQEDVFSSHAPLHFDLSIHDIFVALKHYATVHLIDEETSKNPKEVARLIAEKEVTVWYSTPSALMMLLKFGGLEAFDFPKLRHVLFAGEPFPAKQLRLLKDVWRQASFWNLYGPTETNVVSFYRIPDEVLLSRTEPFPIGKACEHAEFRIDGDSVAGGELLVSGPSVMSGYWRLPQLNELVFHEDEAGKVWYRTGDLVAVEGSGDLIFKGRLDDMIKKNGFRIEPGDIESALMTHEHVEQVKLLTYRNSDDVTSLHAFVVTKNPDLKKSTLRKTCLDYLPTYMMPDRFVMLNEFPQTTTGKIDVQDLHNMICND